MRSRAEVTARYAKAYVRRLKRPRAGCSLRFDVGDGWSRDNARRRLVAAAHRPPGSGRKAVKRPRSSGCRSIPTTP